MLSLSQGCCRSGGAVSALVQFRSRGGGDTFWGNPGWVSAVQQVRIRGRHVEMNVYGIERNSLHTIRAT